MISNLKVLGLAVVVVLAMSAIGASAAPAADWTCSTYSCTVTGSNTLGSEKFTTEGGYVECESHFQGTLSSASSTLSVTPTYVDKECKAFGFIDATIHENGCTYLFHLETLSGAYTNTFDVVCPSGKTMVVTAGTCEVSIPPSTGAKHVFAQNSGSSVQVVPAVEMLPGFTINVLKDGFLCPFNGTGHKKAGWAGEVVFSRVGGGSVSVSG